MTSAALALGWWTFVVACSIGTRAVDVDGWQRPPAGTVPEAYVEAAIDAAGQLAITSDRRAVLVPKAPGQSEFKDPVVSSDGSAVGAQALFPNCCTSYDLPLELVVLSQGIVHRFKGNGLPIFEWQFVDGGARVAYGQQPAHFGCAVHYELRDITTERLIEAVDVPQPCFENVPKKAVRIPAWVKALAQRPR